MCLEYQTNESYFLIKYDDFFIGRKTFKCYKNKLLPVYAFPEYVYKKVSDCLLAGEVLAIEPNNQIQEVAFNFFTKDYNAIQKDFSNVAYLIKQEKLGFHADMFTDSIKESLLEKRISQDTYGIYFKNLPVIFCYDDIQAISTYGGVVVEKFNIPLSANFYQELGKKLGVESIIVKTNWLETLSFFKESLGL